MPSPDQGTVVSKDEPLFSTPSLVPSFADLAASAASGGGLFGSITSGSNSSGFSRAGEVLFSSARKSPTHEDSYNPEAESEAYFRPLVTA